MHKPRVTKENGYAVVHLYGNSYERSSQYGNLLREPIRNIDKLLMTFLPVSVVNKYMNYAWKLHKTVPDSIKMEIKAVADAAGIPYWDLAAINLIPRFLCSGLASWGNTTHDGTMIIGRNAEYPAFGLEDRGSILCIHHVNEKKQILTVTVIGMLGAFTGFSSDGIFFSNMLVENAMKDSINFEGMAIQLQLRSAAEKASSLQEMISIVSSLKPVIPMNILLADSNDAVVIELGLNDYYIRTADSIPAVCVSNHFRSPSLRDFEIDCPRYNVMMDDIVQNSGKITVPVVQNILYDASLRRINIQAIVVEPARKKLYLSMNRVPASKGPYTEIDAAKLFTE